MKRPPRVAERQSVAAKKPVTRTRSGRAAKVPETGVPVKLRHKNTAAAAALLEELDAQKALLERQNAQLREAREKLELTRQHYADVYDLAPVGYLIFDRKGCIQEINQMAARLLGQAASRLIGKSFVGHLVPADRKQFVKHLSQCCRSETQMVTMLRLLSGDGVERYMQFVSFKTRGAGSKSFRCRTALLDVTEQRNAQLALSESEAKFRLMADNLNEVFWFMDLDPPRITYVSPAFERLWGIPAGKIYKQSDAWEQSIHPDDRAAVHAAFQNWIKGGKQEFQNQYRLIGRDGNIRWINDRGIVLSRKDGKISQISGIARDITERKEAAALRNHLATVVESSNDAIITKNADGIITSWNAGAEHIFGYRADEMVGRPISVLIPPDRCQDEGMIFARVLKGERVSHYDTQRRRKDGRIIDVSLSVAPLRDTAGHIIGLSKIARDITDQKHAEERFRSLMEAAPDAMIVANRHGIILLVNTQTEKLFGYQRSEIVGQTMELLVPESLRGRHAKHREEFVKSPRPTILPRALDIHGRRKDGSEFPVEISLSPLLAADETLAISSIRDISERKRAEEQFRGLLESAPDAMIIVNQQGVIELINRQTEKLFGYTHDELIGQTMEILVPERFRHGHAGYRTNYTANPHARQMGGGRELFALRKDGTEFPTEISLSPLKTERGTIVISAIRDMSERKRTEEHLRQSQRFALSTLEAIPASLAVIDETGSIISTNETWRKFSDSNAGSGQTHGVGANYLAVCDTSTGEGCNDATRFAEGVRDVLNGTLPRFVMEYPCHSPGEQRWFIGYVTPFMGDGPRRAVVAHLDISQRKRAEQVIRRLNTELEFRVEQRTAELKRVNESLRGEIEARLRLEAEILEISEREQQRIGQDLHDDLGQQLAGIWCLTQAVETSLLEEKSPSAESVSKITDLLKDALALTRALARGLHPVALQSGGVVTALDELTTRTSSMFRVRCSCKCPQQLEIDNTIATHLYRIAQEAVTNSIKHGHATDIEIELSSNRHHTALSVKDNGKGMPKPDPESKGMGLRIMNYRTDMIGGMLDVRDNPDGDGTMVTCTIPTPPSHERSTRQSYGHKNNQRAGETTGKKRPHR